MKYTLVATFLLLNVCLHAQNTTAETSLKIASRTPEEVGIWQKFLLKNIHTTLPADKGARSGVYKLTVSFMVEPPVKCMMYR